MTIADAIAALATFNFGSPFDQFPLRNYTQTDYNAHKSIAVSNLVSVPGITRISTLSFSAASNNTSIADATVSGTKLLVAGKQIGSATITVTATDFDGGTVSQNFTVNVVAAPGRLVQLSTRMQVGTGDNALIGGFIMRGPSPKRLMIRGIGPSSGLNGALADPVLELHDGTGAVIASNDNWGDAANKQDIIDTGIAPTSPNESAILITVPSDPNNAFYTAIVRGANNTTGLGLVEVYDLDSGPGSTLLNISTRGRVEADPNALIGGFYLGRDGVEARPRARDRTFAGELECSELSRQSDPRTAQRARHAAGRKRRLGFESGAGRDSSERCRADEPEGIGRAQNAVRRSLHRHRARRGRDDRRGIGGSLSAAVVPVAAALWAAFVIREQRRSSRFA